MKSRTASQESRLQRKIALQAGHVFLTAGILGYVFLPVLAEDHFFELLPLMLLSPVALVAGPVLAYRAIRQGCIGSGIYCLLASLPLALTALVVASWFIRI